MILHTLYCKIPVGTTLGSLYKWGCAPGGNNHIDTTPVTQTIFSIALFQTAPPQPQNIVMSSTVYEGDEYLTF